LGGAPLTTGSKPTKRKHGERGNDVGSNITKITYVSLVYVV